jgi:hypothetical protein
MSAEYFNSIGGFSAGIPEVPVVDANGNVITNVLTTGNVAANVFYASYYKWANGQPFVATAAAGGNNTQLQFNNGGAIDGIPNATWNGNILSLGNASSLSIGGGQNGYFLQTNGNGVLTWAPTGNGAGNVTPPGGSNTQVQFNDEGVFAGNNGFTFNKTLGTLSVLSANVGNVTADAYYGNATPTTFKTSDKILYVAKNGNDANNGDINKPYLTIKAALAAASAGGFSVHVAPGTYTEANPVTIPANVALMGDNLRSVFVVPQTPSADLFYVRNGSYVWGITIRDYTANGFSYDPATPSQNVFVSPYIQNLTSSTTTGTAVYIDGNNVSSISTKAMIVGFFTIINRGGKGIHIVNSGYSQLVNIYTIACDIGIEVETGGFCTLNGSDCSIGNYGLVATGYGPLQTTATIVSEYQGIFVLNNLSNGQPNVNTIMVIQDDPEYYTIDTITHNQPGAGQSTVSIQQVFNAETSVVGKTVSFYTRSSIIASAHTFEYVGAGTDPATALPQYGGIPIEANEVIATDGGVITFTSTDQKGNFKVGTGFTINQATGVITGDYFYQSLFAQMTPFILALGSN